MILKLYVTICIAQMLITITLFFASSSIRYVTFILVLLFIYIFFIHWMIDTIRFINS